MSYAAKATMFASLTKGGSMQVRELVDFPGVTVVDKQEIRGAKWKRTIIFGDKEFKTLDDAVSAWKLKEGKL
jgi:hypothetical protein